MMVWWWATDWAESQKALVDVGSAVVGFLAPLFLEWVRERKKVWQNTKRVGESPYPPNPAGLLRADQRIVPFAGKKEADALATLRAATKRSSILLIVDYAETRTGLVKLLRSVPDHPEHVRVLLIARSAGDWWWRLGSDGPAVRNLVHAAVPHFAAALGVPAPRIEITVPGFTRA